ncbi:MAG: class I SAM-dependent methyltransferase [Bacteroidota bacterium]
MKGHSEEKTDAKEWFGEWFDSPYYHILYKKRDYSEAQYFIDKVKEHLNFKPSNKILDLACGKGRHSIYLNSKGLNVVGLDLSEQNIAFAKSFENEKLKFFVHDMREPFREGAFCFVLNMFTSFGYFDFKEEDQQVINSISTNLKPGGELLLDFLNPYRVVHKLVASEKKIVENIEFNISRKFEEGFIKKDISFEDHNKTYQFQEKVRAIRKSTFEEYFQNAGLSVQGIFGDYNLNSYDKESSERMIFICKK